MCVLIFSTFVWNVSHSKKKWAKYDKKCILVFVYVYNVQFTVYIIQCTVYSVQCTVYIVRYSCPILMTLEFSQHIFATPSNIKFHENPSSGSRVVPCGRTDRRMDITKLIVAFRSFANAPNIELCLPVRPLLRNRKLRNFILEGGRENLISLPVASVLQPIFWSNTKA